MKTASQRRIDTLNASNRYTKLFFRALEEAMSQSASQGNSGVELQIKISEADINFISTISPDEDTEIDIQLIKGIMIDYGYTVKTDTEDLPNSIWVYWGHEED